MSRFLEYGVFVPPEQDKNVQAEAASKASFQWVKIGSKWIKVGADGKPLDGPKPLQTEANSSRGLDSSQEHSVPSGSVGFDRKGVGAGLADETAVASGGSSATLGVLETPPPTSDSCDEGSESPGARPAGAARRRSTGQDRARSRRSLRAEDTAENGQDNVDGEGEGGHGGNVGGGSRRSSAGDSERSSVSSGRKSGTSMLTPGLSRTYSREDVVDKFFGGQEDPAGLEAAARGVRVVSGSRDDSAACVGERATGRRSKGLDRQGSGSSNPASSPRKQEKAAADTRDVACQWDGSECSIGCTVPPFESSGCPFHFAIHKPYSCLEKSSVCSADGTAGLSGVFVCSCPRLFA